MFAPCIYFELRVSRRTESAGWHRGDPWANADPDVLGEGAQPRNCNPPYSSLHGCAGHGWSFALICPVLQKYLFFPSSALLQLTLPQNLPKGSAPSWGPRDRGTAVPCAEGKLRHDMTSSPEQGAGLGAPAGAAPQPCGEAQAATPVPGLSQPRPFLPLPPLRLAETLRSRPIGHISGAVLTHRPPVSSQVTQLFSIGRFRAACLPCHVRAADGASPWPFRCFMWPPNQLLVSTGACWCLMSKDISGPDVPMAGGDIPTAQTVLGAVMCSRTGAWQASHLAAPSHALLLLAFPAAFAVQPGWLQRAPGSDRQGQRLNNELRVSETGQQPDPGRAPPAHCSAPKPAAIFPPEP